ncbi:MAG: spore germination protein GerW family protein [Methanobrevibacter sp.]|uniref:GerW family sporulation protein n=1 Tax=Methanobrevibacter sp. TaxID=66852 RepID=UPI0026E1114F|nr:spore germination protein GerW family protein [Methanobrevibacter sp.]MDO5848500.1 spore germination protein GerW family protein [Methanobrevibacter sp.]
MEDTNVKTTVEELQKLLNIENFIGEPIETEDKLLIPVMRAGFGFGSGQNLLGQESNDIVGAGAGAEPVSMVIIPKDKEGIEGIRVINLTGGNEVNKALSDLGLIVTDLINEFVIKPKKEDEDFDEAEFIEPEFKTTDEE